MSINKFPPQITAGLTFEIRLNYPAYPSSAWAGSLLLRGPATIDLAAVPDSSGFVFHADASVTASWAPGDYWYSVRMTSGEDVREAQNGQLKIRPDMATAPAGYDGSTYAQRVLAAIEAVIEHRASIDQENYTINNRSLSRTPISDLLALRDKFRNEVANEQTRATGRNPFNRRIKVVLP